MLTYEPKALRGKAKLVTAPTVEPVLVADFRAHANPPATDDDSDILVRLKAARRLAENYTGRAFCYQAWTVAYDIGSPLGPLDDFWYNETPRAAYNYLGSILEIPRPPLVAVSAVTYYLDGASAATTYAATNYYVDTRSEPGRLALHTGSTWPTGTRAIDSLVVAFTAGYSDSDDTQAEAAVKVPDDIKLAILTWASYLYEQREGQPSDNAGGAIVLNHGQYIPAGVRTLLNPYRVVKQ